jgi:transposase
MEHIAIDLGGKASQICVRNSEGVIVEELRCETVKLGRFLEKRAAGRVILETCAEGFYVADLAKKVGHEVRVVPATLVRSLGVGERGLKTDVRDARKLSEVSCRIDLPSVHVPRMESRERKTLCGMREALVEARTKLVNSVRGWLRGQARRAGSGGVETFPERVKKTAGSQGWELPGSVKRQLLAVEALTEQIRAAKKELEAVAQQDAICRRLMTAPGVGPVTAVRFAAAVDEVGRFAGPHEVESYFGLVPGENSSSEKKRRTGITRAGSPKMRWALTEGAWAAMYHYPEDPMVQWAKRIALRRGNWVAVTALARKMAGILYAMWRDGTDYSSERSAAPSKE